jgi:hypothetical protein
VRHDQLVRHVRQAELCGLDVEVPIAELKRDVKALSQMPTEIVPRYRAFLRHARAKDRALLKLYMRNHDRHVEENRARSGAILDRLWADIMLCLHTDRSVSDKVLARTFDEMRKREKVLRAKAT